MSTVFAAALGLRPNTGADSTAALNAALAALAPGDRLVLAPGTYLISDTLLMKSGTTLSGDGATIRASADWATETTQDPASATGHALLSNVNYGAAGLTDRGLTVTGIAFDYGGMAQEDTHAIRFRQASDIRVVDCSFNGGQDATAFLACDTTLVQNCTANGTLNAAYDAWEGTSNALVLNSAAHVASGSGIVFTGTGTLGEDRTATNVSAIGNTITGDFGPGQMGIQVMSLSPGSAVTGVNITGNSIDGAGGSGSGIAVWGDVRDSTISGNTVANISGPPVLVVADPWNAPEGTTLSDNTILAAATPVLAMGGAQSILTGSGGQFLQLGAGASNIVCGGADTIIGGDGAATISAPGGGVLASSFGSDLNFVNGTGSSTILGGLGEATLFGGGGGVLAVAPGRMDVRGGSGSSTILGSGGDSRILYGGGDGAAMVIGDAGSVSVSGGAGGGVFLGGSAGLN
ncbi:MAG TPA: glycosyl hydrolase family 28-related protein, partial [Acetobacteraceae bacterium]